MSRFTPGTSDSEAPDFAARQESGASQSLVPGVNHSHRKSRIIAVRSLPGNDLAGKTRFAFCRVRTADRLFRGCATRSTVRTLHELCKATVIPERKSTTHAGKTGRSQPIQI